MSYCFNPYCCQPNNEPQLDVCSSCGASLVLKGRYRGVKLLAKSQLALTIEVMEIEPTKLENTNDGDFLVLKILLTNYPKAVSLFQQEAQILGQIDCVGIPKLAANGYFSWQPKGHESHLHCLVISKIPGVDLERWFKQSGNRPIDEQQAKQWLKQILELLSKLHANQYFHRDIKPANLILQPDGKLALIDFGAARKVTATYLGKVGVRQGVTSIGTPGYIAPEQIDGAALPQSDFFALGRTLVHLLTGQHPQELPKDTNTGKILWRQQAPHVSSSFAELLDWLMEHLPGKRPLNVEAITNALSEDRYVNNLRKIRRKLSFRTFRLIVLPISIIGLFGSIARFRQPTTSSRTDTTPLCHNLSCINRDPIDNRCDRDSQTITSDTGNYQVKPHTLEAYRLEIRYSPICQASWARTEAPPGSTHYIEDRLGQKYGSAVVPVDRWQRHYADMAPGKDLEVRACAKPPKGQTKCTNFVQL